MAQPDTEAAHARKLQSAVERLLSNDDALLALTEKHVHEVSAKPGESERDWRARVAQRLISDFSNRSALSGGAAALPALVPGIGTVVALVGGSLADMALTLKFEVELALCLSQLHGFDIRQPRERQLAFLLASVSTFDAKSHGNLFVDLAKAQGTALWNYTPRQVSKVLTTVVGKLALLALSKSLVRMLPVVGVVVGASANKVLTARVGKQCAKTLAERREEREHVEAAGPRVKAKVKGAEKAKAARGRTRAKAAPPRPQKRAGGR